MRRELIGDAHVFFMNAGFQVGRFELLVCGPKLLIILCEKCALGIEE